MGNSRQPHSGTDTSQRWTWTTVEGTARRFERRSVVLRTGASWSDLPERYASYQTCHRRFQQWVRSGIMRGVLEALAEDLHVRVGWMFVNPSSTAALLQAKGEPKVGKTKRGKGTKIMAVADSHGLPVAVCTESATPHEINWPRPRLSR
jgi:transposase